MNDDPARVYLESDHDARLAGAWREVDMDAARADADAGMRLVAYLVISLMFLVAGVVIVAVAAQLR